MRSASIAAAAVAVALTSGCFALALGGLVVKSPLAQASADAGRTTLATEDTTTLLGDLIVPSTLTSVEPLNAVEPLTNADPLTVLTPLIGNSGAGLAGNAGSTLIGNAGAGLAGNAGSTLMGGIPEGFVPAAAFYRILAGSLPSFLPTPTVQAIDPVTGKVVGEGEASGTSYRFSISASYKDQGLIVQALFKKGTDVLAFLASPVAPTSAGATADLSLGTTLAAFTAARLANVEATELKLEKGFAGIANKSLGTVSAATKADKTDLAAASNIVVTSTEFKKVMGTAGSLSREVANTARDKAEEARTSGQTSEPTASVQIAAAITVINKVAEVVGAEGTLGKALDRASADIRVEDVARRSEGKEDDDETGPKLASSGSPDDLATAADRVRASLACMGSQLWVTWQEGGKQVRSALPAAAGDGKIASDGTLPVLTPTASNLLGFARMDGRFVGALYDGSGSLVGATRTFDPKEGLDLYAAAGGRHSAILAYDGPGTVNALLLAATPSLGALTDFKVTKLAISAGAKISSSARDARRPSAVGLGDHFLVVWDEAEGKGRRIVGRFVDPSGELLKDDPIRIYPAEPDGRSRGGAAVSVGTGGFLVAWTEENDGFADVAAIRLKFTGDTDGPAFDVSDALFDQRNPAVTWTGTRFAVAWDDRRTASRRAIGTRLISPGGELGEELVLAAAAYGETPAIASCGGTVAVGWLDGTGAKPKLRAQRGRIVE